MGKTKTITLREARKAAGLTIAELAQKSGVGWSAIHAIEGGRMPGGLNARLRLSVALDVPFAQLWPDSMADIREVVAAVKGKRKPAGRKNGRGGKGNEG